MKHPRRRRALTKTDLLPLPSRKVRDLSLAHHLALSVARTGKANQIQLATLTTTVYMSYFMMEMATHEHDLATLRQAEAALERCLECAASNQSTKLDDDEYQVMEAIVRLHDTQLEVTPSYRYIEAKNRLQRHFTSTPDVSPIPLST